MGKNISTDIVRGIVGDIQSRMGLDEYFHSLSPKVQVEIYERWIEIVSEKLHKEGLVEQVYEPIDLEKMSFGEIVNRTVHYLED